MKSNEKNCYYYTEVVLKNRELVLIDVAIVLTMDHKTLEDENIKQIMERVPTNRLIVQFNKGFKKCNKKHLTKQQSNYDLCDATETALKYAFGVMKLEHVLILEDDAYFVKNMEDEWKSVKDFINKNRFTVYSLGNFGYIVNPFNIIFGDKKHIKVYEYGGSHACIYNKSFLKYFDMNKCYQIDIYSKYIEKSYVYYKPLVIQHLFASSSNYQSWPVSGKILFYILRNICGMFKQYPPEYKDFRRLNYITSTVSLLTLFVIILILIHGSIVFSRNRSFKTLT